MSKSVTWPDPKSFDDAEERIDQLVIDARLIEAQVGDRNKLGTNGERMSDIEYYQWRSRATWALAMKRGEIDFLKGWRRRRQKEFDRMVVSQNFKVDLDDPVSMLFAANSVMHRVLSGNPISQQDQRFMDLVRDYLRDVAHEYNLNL
jgi:hypothetical protein